MIFWSNIAPGHSDVIKDNECDTAFRSNKTFKTLTALVNFYLPLMTMIIISCRIMVAIRSRSKMELGRRLSSATQKQMRHDRTHLTSISRLENETILNENYTDIRPASPIIAINSLDTSNDNVNNLVTIVEPGQCFCSTCQSFGDGLNDSIWQLQQASRRNTMSSLRECLSYAQIKPVSLTLTKASRAKEDKDRAVRDVSRETYEFDKRIKSSASVSDHILRSLPTIANDRTPKKLASLRNQPALRRTFSVSSSDSSADSPKSPSPPASSAGKRLKKSVTL